MLEKQKYLEEKKCLRNRNVIKKTKYWEKT